MGQPSNVTINIIDNTIGVSTPEKGIVFVQGITQRGPVNDPKDLITSARQFKLMFGDDGGDFTLLCLRMLAKGVVLRVNRITDGTGVIAISDPFVSGVNALFAFASKYPGADYNSISVEVLAASNGLTNYFDLKVTHSSDPLVSEYYPNLTITGTPTIATSTYLADVVKNSKFIDPIYKNLSTLTAPLRPTNAVFTLGSDTIGTSGVAPDAADFIGDATTKTGLRAFDSYDDAYILACPDLDEDSYVGLPEAGEAYALLRGDLIYFQHLSNSYLSSTDLLAARPNINSSNILFTAGGLLITHPETGAVYETSELGDVIAAAVAVHNKLGEWRSFTGQSFGVLPNTLGVVNNFGTPAQLADLRLLAHRQVNMAVRKNGLTYLNDDYTGMMDPSALNFASIKFMVLFVSRSLRPTLEKFLGYPNTFSTWEKIYYTVKPFLEGMVSKEAWFSYDWQGDQFVTSLNNLQVNDAVDVTAGKYRARLHVVGIAPLKDFYLDFILDNGANAGVSVVSGN